MMKTEQVFQPKLSRTIQQQHKSGGLAKMIDNRPLNRILDAIQTPLQRASIVQSELQVFDASGEHISRGQTNPPKVVNKLNTYNDVIYDISNTLYQNAHMMAATFGGANAVDNIATWNEIMENNWGNKEDQIRKGNSVNPLDPTRPEANETGTVTTNVNMPETFSAQTLGEAIYNNAKPEIQNLAYWTPIALNPGVVVPHLVLADIVAKDANFKTRVTNRVVDETSTAITKMPNQATIEYHSINRPVPRNFTTTFSNLDEIAHPFVSTDAAKCAKLISNMKVLGSVKAHNFNIP